MGCKKIFRFQNFHIVFVNLMKNKNKNLNNKKKKYGSTDIGLQLSISEQSPLLKIGVTAAI